MVEKLREGIYRVCIPFDDIYTTSFILIEENNLIIFDCGAIKEDVEKYIIPAVNELGIKPSYIILSHTHGDHAGGLEFLMKEYPGAVVGLFSHEIENAHYFYNGEILLERFEMLNLKGHSEDCLAIYDLKTNTLLSGDSLQLFGVGDYGTAVTNLDGYFESLEKVRNLKADVIIASHDYVPMGYIAEGEAVNGYLLECEKAIENFKDFSKEHSKLTKRELIDLYNKINADLPRVHLGNVISWI